MAEEKVVSASLMLRSTGLGNTMLYAEPESCSVEGNILVLHIKTVSPVQWHIRTGITYRGMLKLLWCLFKNSSIIKFLFFGFIRLKNPVLTQEF